MKTTFIGPKERNWTLIEHIFNSLSTFFYVCVFLLQLLGHLRSLTHTIQLFFLVQFHVQFTIHVNTFLPKQTMFPFIADLRYFFKITPGTPPPCPVCMSMQCTELKNAQFMTTKNASVQHVPFINVCDQSECWTKIWNFNRIQYHMCQITWSKYKSNLYIGCKECPKIYTTQYPISRF